jgi:hypothetical protein
VFLTFISSNVETQHSPLPTAKHLDLPGAMKKASKLHKNDIPTTELTDPVHDIKDRSTEITAALQFMLQSLLYVYYDMI